MGIAGAALYSLLLIGTRELAPVASLAAGALRRAWHALAEGIAHYSASLYPPAHVEDPGFNTDAK